MTRRTYKVPDVSCGHCKASIEKVLGTMGGVESVHVNVDDKTVDVSFNEEVIPETEVKEALAQEGYPVVA